jgi:ubiquitin carboxyl-terminal hydrolase 36/42
MEFRLKLTSDDNIPSGLINGGNTCFVSAVLQCLVNTHPLQVYLTSSEHLKAQCPLSQGHGSLVNVKHSFCPICHLKAIVALMLDPKYSAIMPRDLLLNLEKIGEFRLGDQEDAHQFLLDMLFKIHDAFVYVDTINRKLAAAKKGETSKQPDFVDSQDRQLVEETSFVYQMFGGRFLHKTRCIECGRISMNPEPFLVLSLGLASGASVEEALRNFCKIEVLPKGDESLVCETCQRRVTVQRQTTFWQAPEILILHLKRFDNSGRKINKSVAFSQTMDFTDVISRDAPNADKEKTTYSLYAMITHYGPFMGAGHYVAFAKLDGKWYLFDDKSVYGINESIVMKQNAYILFYKKSTTPIQTSNSSSSQNILRASNGLSSSTPSSSSTAAAAPSSSQNHLKASNGLSSATSANTSLSSSSDAALAVTEMGKLQISHLTPPCKAYLAQEGDEMKDMTLRIHLPQLESLAMKDLGLSLTPSGRFELKSPVYYLLLELVFPLEPSRSKAIYFEQDRTLVVFAPIAQEHEDSSEPVALTSSVNVDRMSEDDFTFQDESIWPVDPIVGIEESLTEEEEKLKKGQNKIEALNIETATYKELHENIRELQRNPQRITQGATPATTSAPSAAKSGATPPAAGSAKRIKPNEPCPCGSSRKYKVCHGKGL